MAAYLLPRGESGPTGAGVTADYQVFTWVTCIPLAARVPVSWAAFVPGRATTETAPASRRQTSAAAYVTGPGADAASPRVEIHSSSDGQQRDQRRLFWSSPPPPGSVRV